MAWNLIASTSAGAPGNVTTPAIDTTGADFLAVANGYFNVSDLGPITDSKGNVWEQATFYGGGGGYSTKIYIAENPIVGAGHTVSVSIGNVFPGLAFTAWTGAALSNILDQQTGGAGATPGSLTTSQSGSLALISGCDNSASVLTISDGYLSAEQLPYLGGNYMSARLGYKDLTGTGDPSWVGYAVQTSSHALILPGVAPPAASIIPLIAANVIGISGALGILGH